MEILIGLFLIGIVILLLFLFSLPTTSGHQGEDTWNKWINQYSENPKKFKQYTKKEKENLAKDAKYRTYEQIGNRGGRYEERISKKTGKPYRHYF